MPVPTHRDGCETKMYKISCPDCGDSVYYFSCSCGSKVLFDYNIPPWGPHERRCWLYLMRICIEIYDLKEDYIIDFIEKYAFETKQSIPKNIKDYLTKLKGSTKLGKLIVAEIMPTDRNLYIIGTIREINRSINFFKKFGIENNQMGKMLLGKLMNESHLMLIIREGRKDDNTCSEFTVYIPLEKFNKKGLKLNELITAEIVPHQIVGGRYIWMIDQINKLK